MSFFWQILGFLDLFFEKWSKGDIFCEDLFPVYSSLCGDESDIEKGCGSGKRRGGNSYDKRRVGNGSGKRRGGNSSGKRRGGKCSGKRGGDG